MTSSIYLMGDSKMFQNFIYNINITLKLWYELEIDSESCLLACHAPYRISQNVEGDYTGFKARLEGCDVFFFKRNMIGARKGMSCRVALASQ